MGTNDLDPTGTTESDPTGTPAATQDGGSGAAAGGSGEDVEAIRRENEELRRQKEQLLAEKANTEAARQAALEAQRATDHRAAPGGPANAPLVEAVNLMQYAANGGAVDMSELARAQLLIATATVQDQAEREQRVLAQQRKLADDAVFERMTPEQRAGARDYYASGDFRTPEAARKAWLGDLSEKERARMTNERAASAAARQSREEGVINTAPRGLSATETRRRMTHTEYNKLMESAPNDDARAKIMREHGDAVDFGA